MCHIRIPIANNANNAVIIPETICFNDPFVWGLRVSHIRLLINYTQLGYSMKVAIEF